MINLFDYPKVCMALCFLAGLWCPLSDFLVCHFMHYRPRKIKYADGKGYFCPRCRGQVYVWTLSNRPNQYIQTDYCPRCGQRLKWPEGKGDRSSV